MKPDSREGQEKSTPQRTIAQLAVEIRNLAHYAWNDPENAEYLFTEIENRGKEIALRSGAGGEPTRSCLGCGFMGDPWIKHEPSGVFLCEKCTLAIRRVAGGEPEQPEPNANMLEYWLRDYAQFRPNWWPMIEEYLKSLPAPAQGKEQK